MARVCLKTKGRGVVGVTGEMSFTTVPDLWEQSRRLFPMIEGDHLEIDLTDVSRTDSAGLALLVAWTRWAKSRSKSLRFIHVRPGIKALSEANQLNRLLTLEVN
jgi:phospholipid transport system transporter-binding protein